MKVLKIVFYLCCALVLLVPMEYGAQVSNTTCANAAPFCTGQTMNFPALTGVASGGQTGPNYGCLFSQPNPTWFFMQIQNSGPMVITMSANQDIDFICWGPFSALAGACSSLTSGNTQACSYSSSNTETCTISNAIAGQFYILLITNYAGVSQNITFQQQNSNAPGAATTNCGFVCSVTATNSGIMCAGQTNTLSLTTSSAVNSYTWFGPNSYSSTSAFNTISNLLSTSVFTVKASATSTINNVPTTGTCQATTTITVVPYPNFSISPGSPTICQGGNIYASVSFSAGSGPGPFTYSWAPATGAGIFNTNQANTTIAPPLLPTTVSLATIVYSVTVSPASLSCPITNTFAITINNPLTPTLTLPAPLCNTSGPVNLVAVPGGGTWTALGVNSVAVSPSGVLSPGLAGSPSVALAYALKVGTCNVSNSGTVLVAQFNTAALSNTLNLTCEQDPLINLMGIVQNTIAGQWSGGPFVSNNYFNPSGLASGNYTLHYNTLSTQLNSTSTVSPYSSVCPHSTMLVVQVFNPPTPTINAILPSCNTSPTVALIATPSGGIWSLNSGVSSSGVQTPSSCATGSNNVLYTAGIGTCVASSSATFHVSKFNTAALSGTVPPLCSRNSPVGLMSIVQSTVNGVWTGTNIVSNASASSYSLNPNLPTGVYTLTYSTTSWPIAGLCDDSRTIAVSVLNPPTPNISTAGPYCTRDGAVQLSVSPANSGTWTAYPYMSGNGVFTPSLGAVGGNLVQYVTGTSTCSAQQTRTINVEAFVPATITNHVADQCNTGSAVSLLPITLSNAGIWSGTGILGSNFSPSSAGAGTHVLTYNTASSPSGLCPDQATVSVRVFSLATPVVSKAGPFCNTASSVKLQVSPVGGLFAGANNGAVTPAGLFNPAQGIIGDNIVSYSISSGPCIAFVQSTISVEKFISADFATAQPISFCQGDEPVNLDSYVINPGGIWTGSGVTGNMFDPKKASPGSKNTIFYQTFSSPNALLCPDRSSVFVTVNPTPTVELSSSQYEGCSPLEISFDLKPLGGTGGGKADWYIGDGSQSVSGLSTSRTFTLPGVYTITANYFTDKGCVTQATLKTPITIYESPKADFGFEPAELTIANPEVSLNNLSTVMNNNRYQWFVQGMNPVFELNPKITFPSIGIYQVKLLATSYNGCKDEVTKFIEVKNDFNVFIPSSFSPNADGINDYFFPVFSPFGLDASSFEMDVFDRWGHVIYHTRDYTKGWDGTLNNKGDITLKQDNYIYKIKFKDAEGRIYNKIGSFTLMGK